MLNLMSYIRGWLDGKGIDHEDTDLESNYVNLYNTKLDAGGTYSISWGWSPKTNHAISLGWPERIEGVYMMDLECGGEPASMTVDEFKTFVERCNGN